MLPTDSFYMPLKDRTLPHFAVACIYSVKAELFIAMAAVILRHLLSSKTDSAGVAFR